jgi:DedD protein
VWASIKVNKKVIKGAFKQRLVGAVFILSLGVILIPLILDSPRDDAELHYASKPSRPALPEISDVAKISYVFNEMEQEINAASEVTALAEPLAPEPAPVSERASIPKPLAARVSPSVTPSLGEWTIQLGAFSSVENANELLNRLSQEGFPTYLKTTPGRKLVRVFVGPGVDKDKAQALLVKLDTEFGLKGILVRYREQ